MTKRRIRSEHIRKEATRSEQRLSRGYQINEQSNLNLKRMRRLIIEVQIDLLRPVYIRYSAHMLKVNKACRSIKHKGHKTLSSTSKCVREKNRREPKKEIKVQQAELVEFFLNASVRDDKVVSAIQVKSVEISEEIFAGTFELSTEGLTYMHDVPKDLVFDSRSAFSTDGQQLKTSCNNREMKFDFRLLNDILAKTVTVKADSIKVLSPYANPNASSSTSSSSAESDFSSSSSSTSIPIDFVNEETHVDQISMPTTIVSSNDYTNAFAQLKASVDQISLEQVRQIWDSRAAGAEPAVVIVFINGQRFRVLDVVVFDLLTNLY
ncbi:hypothetical protein F511_36082 [Dorcoceras hygrometricum]|uniref:Uncharacterized protein n=1 Tax=Dorcoceras hygrometricum TaxID=472368 RepID=A0A2Z7CLI8_9LAMI|nr:hypothetical protein F511_36082 [Dorcoceras hygrometricum]